MKVSLLLLSTLDELGADDFKRFQWNLTQPLLDGCKPILKRHLENANRQDTVNKMMENYSNELAVMLAVEILKLMDHSNAAEKLAREFAGGSTAAPADGATAGAMGKSVIVAPNIHGTSSGAAVNLNINTKY